MHAWGAAIDLNTKFADYWLWNPKVAYRNRIPIEIVEIFEKHGFIWGGKWGHFDTMHFEYRPELLPDLSESTNQLENASSTKTIEEPQRCQINVFVP